eukprot:846766-Pyramimonas_sp.AAC.1
MPRGTMVVDLLDTPEVHDARQATIQKDVFDLGHLAATPRCRGCKYLGDDKDVRCSMRGRNYLDMHPMPTAEMFLDDQKSEKADTQRTFEVLVTTKLAGSSS